MQIIRKVKSWILSLSPCAVATALAVSGFFRSVCVKCLIDFIILNELKRFFFSFVRYSHIVKHHKTHNHIMCDFQIILLKSEFSKSETEAARKSSSRYNPVERHVEKET